jgi:hypothetical protein
MSSLATTLPAHSDDGYVAAAYIAFFAIVLIYVAIMAIRLGRVERKLQELQRDGHIAGTTSNSLAGGASLANPAGERETV